MKRFEGFQRGVNLGGWLSQCVSYDKAHFDGFITEKDIKDIKSFGLDHVRVPVDYDVFMNESSDGDTVNEEGMAHIDDCIGWCRSNGLNMILDLHKANGYMFDTNEVADPDRFSPTKTFRRISTKHGRCLRKGTERTATFWHSSFLMKWSIPIMNPNGTISQRLL